MGKREVGCKRDESEGRREQWRRREESKQSAKEINNQLTGITE